MSPAKTVKVNRAPVLTLWAAVVAERLGYDSEEALTLGKGLAGLNAQSKGRRLGIFHEAAKEKGARARKPSALAVPLLGREVPAVKTRDGIRAAVRGAPVSPESVQRYLESKFGESLDAVREAMQALARAFDRKTLERDGFSLYERFRPQIPEGTRGWGAAGELDLARIRSAGLAEGHHEKGLLARRKRDGG